MTHRRTEAEFAEEWQAQCAVNDRGGPVSGGWCPLRLFEEPARSRIMTITLIAGLILYLVAGIATATGVLVCETETVDTATGMTVVGMIVAVWPIVLVVTLPMLFARLIRERAWRRKPAAWSDDLDARSEP